MKKLILVSVLAVLDHVVFSVPIMAEEKPAKLFTTPTNNVCAWRECMLVTSPSGTNQTVWCTMPKYSTTPYQRLGALTILPTRKVTRLERTCDWFTYVGATEGLLGKYINNIGEDSLTGGKGLPFLGGRANWEARWKHPISEGYRNINGIALIAVVRWELPEPGERSRDLASR